MTAGLTITARPVYTITVSSGGSRVQLAVGGAGSGSGMTPEQAAKLDGIETGADVTDAGNVIPAIAGATISPAAFGTSPSMDGFRVADVGYPEQATDAIPKIYVDQPPALHVSLATDTISIVSVGRVTFYEHAGPVLAALPDLSAALEGSEVPDVSGTYTDVWFWAGGPFTSSGGTTTLTQTGVHVAGHSTGPDGEYDFEGDMIGFALVGTWNPTDEPEFGGPISFVFDPITGDWTGTWDGPDGGGTWDGDRVGPVGSLYYSRALILDLQCTDPAGALTIDPGAGVTIDGSASNYVAATGRTRTRLVSSDGLAWITQGAAEVSAAELAGVAFPAPVTQSTDAHTFADADNGKTFYVTFAGLCTFTVPHTLSPGFSASVQNVDAAAEHTYAASGGQALYEPDGFNTCTTRYAVTGVIVRSATHAALTGRLDS